MYLEQELLTILGLRTPFEKSDESLWAFSLENPYIHRFLQATAEVLIDPLRNHRSDAGQGVMYFLVFKTGGFLTC